MKTNPLVTLALAGALGAALTPYAASAESLAVNLGKIEYRSNCASCHGAEGKGDGPMADQLTVAPANLQMISKNNGGVFPFDRVYDLVDGRDTLRAHGPSEMPIWGEDYAVDAATMSGQRDANRHSIEAAVAGRVLSLVYYLRSIQQP